jgi:hypothetical protein
MGRIAYSLKKRWKDGTTHVVMTKQVLMWLCALVPKPRKHLATYHGVLAKAAGLRSQVPRRVEKEREGERCNHGTAGAAAAVPAMVAVNGEEAAFRRRQLQRRLRERLRERLRVPHGGGKRPCGRRRYPWASLLMRV